jgi:predicted nucleic acid-binding protein
MKIVADTNVLVAAICGKYKSGKSKSYNMKIYELILRDEVEIFSSNDLVGEIMKTFSTDPDLKNTNRQYFYSI